MKVDVEAWRYGIEGFASAFELDLAALLLVYYSRAFNRKDGVLEIMRDVIEYSPGYTAGNISFRSPQIWLASRKYILREIRDMLDMAASHSKDLLAPVAFIVAHNFSARMID